MNTPLACLQPDPGESLYSGAAPPSLPSPSMVSLIFHMELFQQTFPHTSPGAASGLGFNPPSLTPSGILSSV